MKQFFSSLKTVSKTAIFMLALLCAVVQGARADEVKTQCTDGVFSGFTATGEDVLTSVRNDESSDIHTRHGGGDGKKE